MFGLVEKYATAFFLRVPVLRAFAGVVAVLALVLLFVWSRHVRRVYARLRKAIYSSYSQRVLSIAELDDLPGSPSSVKVTPDAYLSLCAQHKSLLQPEASPTVTCNVLRSAVPALDTPLALVVAEYAQTPVTELVVWAGPAPWEKVTDRPKATVAPVSRHALAAASRASSAAARRAAAEGDREKASDGKGKEKEADAEEEKKPASTYTLKQKPVEYIKNMRPPVMEVASISDDALFAQIGSALGLPPVVVPLGAGAGSGSSSGASASAGAGSGAGASGAVREVHAPLVLGELLVALSHCEDRCAELLPLRIDLLAAASASAPASAAASAAAGPPALPLTLVTVGAVGRRPLQVLAPNQALRIPAPLAGSARGIVCVYGAVEAPLAQPQNRGSREQPYFVAAEQRAFQCEVLVHARARAPAPASAAASASGTQEAAEGASPASSSAAADAAASASASAPRPAPAPVPGPAATLLPATLGVALLARAPSRADARVVCAESLVVRAVELDVANGLAHRLRLQCLRTWHAPPHLHAHLAGAQAGGAGGAGADAP